MAIKQYMRRHGIKLCWVAGTLGMDEALLRYHINRGLNDPQLIRQFKELMRAHAAALLEDLDEIQDEQP